MTRLPGSSAISSRSGGRSRPVEPPPTRPILTASPTASRGSCLRLFWDAAADPLALAALADARRGEPDEEELAGLALTPAEEAALGSVLLHDEEDILRRLADAAVQTENLARADAVAASIDGLW